MARKVVTITHPDGSKKIIVGSSISGKTVINSSEPPVKSKPAEEDRRPKPGTPKISVSKEKNGYKYGGKLKLKIS